MSPDLTIAQGDARSLPLPPQSVDLVVTSPPYFNLRDYGQSGQIGSEQSPAEYIASLIACTREMVRVLKPSGSIFVNLGDKYATAHGGGESDLRGSSDSGAGRGARTARPRPTVPIKSLNLIPERYRIACVDDLGLAARAVVVWSKTNPAPETVRDRVWRSHEDWVHVTRSRRYFESTAELPGPIRRRSVWELTSRPLRVPRELGIQHTASFPPILPRHLIQGWCPPSGVVLDPFGGAGTVALVANVLGRHAISIDLSEDYCRLARWRCSDVRERAHARGLDSPAATVLPGQIALLDGGAA
jgi:DNA modification methylase